MGGTRLVTFAGSHRSRLAQPGLGPWPSLPETLLIHWAPLPPIVSGDLVTVHFLPLNHQSIWDSFLWRWDTQSSSRGCEIMVLVPLSSTLHLPPVWDASWPQPPPCLSFGCAPSPGSLVIPVALNSMSPQTLSPDILPELLNPTLSFTVWVPHPQAPRAPTAQPPHSSDVPNSAKRSPAPLGSRAIHFYPSLLHAPLCIDQQNLFSLKTHKIYQKRYQELYVISLQISEWGLVETPITSSQWVMLMSLLPFVCKSSVHTEWHSRERRVTVTRSGLLIAPSATQVETRGPWSPALVLEISN